MLQRKIEEFLPALLVYYVRDFVHRQDYMSPLGKPLAAVEQSSGGVFICLYKRGSSIYRVN